MAINYPTKSHRKLAEYIERHESLPKRKVIAWATATANISNPDDAREILNWLQQQRLIEPFKPGGSTAEWIQWTGYGRGFGTRKYRYKLNIQHDQGTYAIEFVVEWQGTEHRTHQRAIRVGVSIFAIAQYGSTSAAYPLIAEQLGEESCEGIVSIYEALQGQQFTGKLRARDGAIPNRLISEMATQHGLVQGVEQFEARDVAALLG